MGLADIYQLTDKSVMAGQQVLNVYFYQTFDVTQNPDAELLSDAYIEQILPSVLAVQTNNVVHTEISVQNLFNPSDKFVTAISVSGTNSVSDTMPNFVAVSFSLAQDNGAVKNGSKRYAGLGEDQVTDGIITGPALLGVLSDLGDALITPLLKNAVTVFTPVVVKRLLEPDGKYTLPTALAEAVWGLIVDATYSVIATSQTSRKIGKGA